MPLQATSGAASYDGFGGGVAAVPNYIEDVFNTYVWTGTGSNQTLTTNVDTSTYGGLFWTKNRTNAYDHALWATNFSLSGNYLLKSNTTGALTYGTYNTGDYVSNSTTGVTVYGNSSQNYVTWTFRKQPKFFDVVTYTGNGVDGRDISHSLGSSPGFVVIKCTSSSTYWVAKHKDALSLTLNTTNAQGGSANTTNGYVSSVSSTSFNVVAGLTDLAAVNASGQTYVAYLFAHNAGGFGLTGTDNVISCGFFMTDASANASVTLGYEPQWVLIKRIDGVGYWDMLDNMRGMTVGTSNAFLWANTSDAEMVGQRAQPFATGFNYNGSNSASYIYIAIRRGPMKVPTSGTSVFYPNAVAQADSPDSSNVPFPPDLVNTFSRDGVDRYQSNQFNFVDRLRGLGTPNNTYTASGPALTSSSTIAESSTFPYVQLKADSQNITRGSGWNSASYGNWIYYFMRRAPSFFDEVCYTGTGSAGQTYAHNLGAVPELMIFKSRSNAATNWPAWSNGLTNAQCLLLNLDVGKQSAATVLNSTTPTSSVFTVGTDAGVNTSGATYVAYLFATCPGVSKVGSYTGNGTTQTIDCGFTGGARFVLIKRTDSTGDWYVWDTARGIISANDPHLSLNTTAAEVTTDDTIDTDSTGFIVNQVTATNVNVSSATYIYLAIA